MRAETLPGGDGVLCWNVEPIARYVAAVEERETRLSQDNPDVVVHPGVIKCYGCEVMEFDLGTRCTATLTRTLYAVKGEVAPRAEDANGSLTEIPGMVTRLDADPPATPMAETVATDGGSRRAGLRNLFGRHS
jgi:hypothetical protein